VFPARTHAQVVALATQQRITGAATYDARQEGTRYRFSIAQKGPRVRGRFATAGGGSMWVGYERGRGVTFVCVRQPLRSGAARRAGVIPRAGGLDGPIRCGGCKWMVIHDPSAPCDSPDMVLRERARYSGLAAVGPGTTRNGPALG